MWTENFSLSGHTRPILSGEPPGPLRLSPRKGEAQPCLRCPMGSAGNRGNCGRSRTRRWKTSSASATNRPARQPGLLGLPSVAWIWGTIPWSSPMALWNNWWSSSETCNRTSCLPTRPRIPSIPTTLLPARPYREHACWHPEQAWPAPSSGSRRPICTFSSRTSRSCASSCPTPLWTSHR